LTISIGCSNDRCKQGLHGLNL